MRQAQELSLNLIVIGALALLVLLIVGGVLIFGGGDFINSIMGLGPSDEQVLVTSFGSACQTRCSILKTQVDSNDLTATSPSSQTISFLKSYCCEASDLNQNGIYEASGSLGAEICGSFYDCKVGTLSSLLFCRTVPEKVSRDFTSIGDTDEFDVCGLN